MPVELVGRNELSELRRMCDSTIGSLQFAMLIDTLHF